MKTPASWLGLAMLVASLWGLGACTTDGPPRDARDGRELRDLPTNVDQTNLDRRAQARMELAAAYFGRGQFTVALDEVKQALQARPELASAFNLRGLIYGAMEQPALAEESFRRAMQLAPRDGDVQHNYGWFLCQQGRYPEATQQFRNAMAQPGYRDQTRSLLTLGICLARNGQLIEAEGALTRAYEADPSNASTAVNLSEVLFKRGELERARFYMRRVNAVQDVSNAQTLWLAARIEHRLGNAAGAQELGRQIVSRFPQSREALAFERGRFDD